MGLEVTTYGNIKLAQNEEDADFVAYVISDDWRIKVRNLQYGKGYNGDAVFEGVSCSYSAHSRFREELIKLINRGDLLDGKGKIKWVEIPNEIIPFHEFIYFADNEGCLDWEVSLVIYNDFKRFNNKAKLEMSEYYYSMYETWLETFRCAKDYGVVVFS